MCFACGPANPAGLRLAFSFDGEEYVTCLAVAAHHQGWAGLMHGGLLATVLDEAMARLLWEKGINAITGKLEVRYRQPVRVGEDLQVRARIAAERGRRVETRKSVV